MAPVRIFALAAAAFIHPSSAYDAGIKQAVSSSSGDSRDPWLFRIVHVDNLPTLLQRDGLHAPNSTPAFENAKSGITTNAENPWSACSSRSSGAVGLQYHTIHNANVQASRSISSVPCGPGGTIHDYIPFYFGPLSVMLLNLHTGRVEGYNEGQSPIVYLITSIARVIAANRPWVFSDGHGLAALSSWYDCKDDLDQVDWDLVGQRYWADKPEDNDRKRRKQAEFLVWQHLPWSAIAGIEVLNDAVKATVESTLAAFPTATATKVLVKRNWYY